jgi:hypothetical protein
MHELPVSYCEQFITIPDSKNHLGFLVVNGRIILEGMFIVQDISCEFDLTSSMKFQW